MLYNLNLSVIILTVKKFDETIFREELVSLLKSCLRQLENLLFLYCVKIYILNPGENDSSKNGRLWIDWRIRLKLIGSVRLERSLNSKFFYFVVNQ